MRTNNPALLILAAGMGSRYGGLKQLDGVGPSGETIMDYSVYDAVKAGFKKIVFVIRSFFREDFEKNILSKYGNIAEFQFVEQEPDKLLNGFMPPLNREKPWGTGHAVLTGAEKIDSPFGVINADDYYGINSFKVLFEFLSLCQDSEGDYAMVGFCTNNTLSESGPVSRGICTVDNKCNLTSVEEHHNISMTGNIITGVNSMGESVKIESGSLSSMNMWGFTPDLYREGNRLFQLFLIENGQNIKAEFYIPFIVNQLIQDGYATCKVLTTPDKWFGITYKEDREKVSQKIESLVKKGVYPTPLFKNLTI